MKKALAILLASMMLLSFAACGKDNTQETTAPTTTANEASADEASTENVTTTAPAVTTAEATTATPKATDNAPVIEAGETAVFRGTVSDNIYMSAFSGLSFTADEKWTFLSDADLAALVSTSLTEEDIANDKLPSTIKTHGAVYDMYAQLISEDNTLDAQVMISLLDANNADVKDKSLQETVELLATAAFGLDLANATTGSATLGGESYYKIDMVTDNANVSIFGCKIGTVYVVCVTASSVESGLDLTTMFK